MLESRQSVNHNSLTLIERWRQPIVHELSDTNMSLSITTNKQKDASNYSWKQSIKSETAKPSHWQYNDIEMFPFSFKHKAMGSKHLVILQQIRLRMHMKYLKARQNYFTRKRTYLIARRMGMIKIKHHPAIEVQR